MQGRKLLAPALVVAALVGAAPAHAADTSSNVIVCNEAENSARGGYVVSGGTVDPSPPAFNRGSAMRIGDGAGVTNAADRSPALRECAPPRSGGDAV
jgi:hypothetical protein